MLAYSHIVHNFIVFVLLCVEMILIDKMKLSFQSISTSPPAPLLHSPF